MANGGQSRSLQSLIDTLPGWAQLVGIIGALAAAGAAVVTAGTTIQEDHKVFEARIDSIEVGHSDLEGQVEQLQGTTNSVDRKVDRLLCIGEAERGERSYEQCVK